MTDAKVRHEALDDKVRGLAPHAAVRATSLSRTAAHRQIKGPKQRQEDLGERIVERVDRELRQQAFQPGGLDVGQQPVEDVESEQSPGVQLLALVEMVRPGALDDVRPEGRSMRRNTSLTGTGLPS